MSTENILLRGVLRIFDLSGKTAPGASAETKYAAAKQHVEEALSSMLNYTDCLRVAVALNDYADRISMEVEQRRKDHSK